MSYHDSIALTSIPGASSGSALPTVYTTALDLLQPDISILSPSQSSSEDIRLVVPPVNTYRVVGPESTLLGYSLGYAGASSGHFMEVDDALSHSALKLRMIKLACHFLIDVTPSSGLEEMLEKAADIREYYCQLGNWRAPLPVETKAVPVNPVVASYERESFFYVEE